MRAREVVGAKNIRKQARAWMLMNDIRILDIQEALKMTHGPISHTLAGDRHNRRVLAYLLEKGCPSEYLALPKDMREGKA